MGDTGLVQILEGALMAAGEALSLQRMSQLFDEFDRPANADLREHWKRWADVARAEDMNWSR